ncbi:hypothetical protein KIN20_033526 [Parelaphostrongylus tenuis]|uniref:Saposin A-type domain-containing protein n=1 Tax=Parelaphostrongylus tenuis TaxID=148309 RepID=A0AAD5WIH8_PARTN|nr:hypothetical protein KIN20_033526 [Parelaphostrongylus tenuis]
MLLNVLLLGLSAVSADRCASVPSSLWCANDELSKQCGFEDLCNRYRLNHNKPINITVLMEALCPDCQLWIVEEFYPKVFKNFAKFINIELVPFGNAKITSTVPFENATAKCFSRLPISEEVQRMIQFADKIPPYWRHGNRLPVFEQDLARNDTGPLPID